MIGEREVRWNYRLHASARCFREHCAHTDYRSACDWHFVQSFPYASHFQPKGVLRGPLGVFSSSQTINFWHIQAGGLCAKETRLGHRFGAATKVNENRHLGSSAFWSPSLHRESSFLYEVIGSNPSRAINSVHPRQARCLSILRKFRRNICKGWEGHGCWLQTRATRPNTFRQILFLYEPLDRWVNKMLSPATLFGGILPWTISQRRMTSRSHVWSNTAPVWMKCVTVNSGRFWGHPDLLHWQ